MLASTEDIEGAAIVTADGLFIAAILPSGIMENRLDLISASFAALAFLGHNFIRDLDRGPQDTQVYIKAQFGTLLLFPVDEEMYCLLLCRPQAKLGMIFTRLLGGGLSGNPLASALEPILPRHPPGRLTARAKPEYDDEE